MCKANKSKADSIVLFYTFYIQDEEDICVGFALKRKKNAEHRKCNCNSRIAVLSTETIKKKRNICGNAIKYD